MKTLPIWLSLAKQTNFNGSIDELKVYTLEWLKETRELANNSLYPGLAYPCNQKLFLNKFYLLYSLKSKLNYPNVALNADLASLVVYWRERNWNKLEKIIKTDEIDETGDLNDI